MNIALIIYCLGFVLLFEAGFMILPIITALFYSEKAGISFLIIAVILAIVGFVITRFKPEKKNFFAKEGFTTVALAWIILSLTGALPFFISKEIPNYLDALFEIVSGFTTTGASILSNIEGLSYCMLFWRSFSNWIGGMGVLVFILAILPLSGASNIMLMKAESPGPTTSKVVPKIKTTAFYLYLIYLFLTLIQLLLLLLVAKEPFFDAICISMSTAGTGGFAIKNTSFVSYSHLTQTITTIFMYLFGINFSIYYLLLTKKIKDALKSEELWSYLGIFIVATLAITISNNSLFDNFFDSLHHSAFQVSSIITTTGFSTIDFDQWTSFSKTILVILMFIGAMAGSTGGGIKVSRILIAFKASLREIDLCIHPKNIKAVKLDGKAVEETTIKSVTIYFVTYIFIFVASLLIISLDDFGFTTHFTAVAATLNNIGPGLDGVGPMMNFNGYSYLSKVVLIIDMLIGRLELYPILVLFSFNKR